MNRTIAFESLARTLRPSRPGYAFRNLAGAVPYGVGGLLIVAAGLKAEQFFNTDHQGGGLFQNRWLQIFLVELECALGLALLLRLKPPVVRVACQLLFVAFLAVAIYHLAFSASSCGCLGKVRLAPVAAVAVDLLVLLALWWWKPTPPAPTNHTKSIAAYAYLAIILATLALAATGVAWTSAPAAPAVEVVPAMLDLGTLRQGEKRRFTLDLHNRQEQPVAIDRLEFSCQCLQGNQSAWTLPALQTTVAEFVLDLGQEPDFTGDLVLEVRGRLATGRLVFSASIQARVAPALGN